MDVLAQFFFYMALTLVPMALPMSILLTSLLTFGNMAEQLELTALKSAGIPLIRIMRPLIITAAMLMCVSFYFQNNISPKAQTEMARMLYSMKNTSPALEIPEGIFYNGIPNINLYVERKDADTGMLYGVIIYKIDNGIEKAQIVVSDSAKLETTADKHFLKLSVYNGEQFENLSASTNNLLSKSQVPYDRETFQYKTLLIDFDSDFDLMSAEDLKNTADTKPLDQLKADADSMTHLYDSLGCNNYVELAPRYLQTGYLTPADSALAATMARHLDIDTLISNLPQDRRLRMLQTASSTVGSMLVELEWRTPVSHDGYYMIRRHQIKWHDKFTSALACLFFFFIGAPLGAIIGKGGLGVSTIVSVLIFIIYYIISISGMKLARDGTWNIVYGMWIATCIMTPIGVFLTYKSNHDSTILNVDYYKHLILHALGYRPKRSYELKEVIIDDPDYQSAADSLRDTTQRLRELDREQRLSQLPSYIRLFFAKRPDNQLPAILDQMEQTIVALSDSDAARLVYKLNDYPTPYRRSHLSPTPRPWLNKLLGIIFPIGLCVWIRTAIFRRKLHRDIETISETSKQITARIEQKHIKI